jgi:integrase
MAQKATGKRTGKTRRVAKVMALATDRGATAAEVNAAKAALERIGERNLLVPESSTKVASREPLSDAIVRRLPVPQVGSAIRWDGVAGFGIRVNAGGGKVFFFNYRTKTGRQRRYTIGAYPSWATSSARIEARRLDHLVDQGGDPLGELQEGREAPTVTELIERFKAEHLSRKRESTAIDYGRMIRNHIAPALGKLKVTDVAFTDIDHLHRRISAAGHPYRANRVIAVVSKMFSLAVRWKLRDDNPTEGVEKNLEYQRRRYLTDDELAGLIKALASHPEKQTADAIRLLLLTGARRGEVLAMRWGDVDLTKGTWSKPASSTKQKEPHQVPLSPPARRLLQELAQQSDKKRELPEFVFTGAGQTGHIVEIKRSWRRICKAAGISNLRLHDLRHSFASALVSDGASLPLIGALLGHSNPSTTLRYAHLFDSPMRKAVERVGAVIDAAGQPALAAAPTLDASQHTRPTRRRVRP